MTKTKKLNRKQTTPRNRRRTIACEQLEERWTPAQFGIPWSDSTHLTMSFVPDGTQVETEASQLQSALDAQLPRASWQRAILRAAQTWASVANVNIGLVSDGGQQLGVAGAMQGDPRFGDIRIAGLPLGDDALAISIPPSNTTAGTYSGDIIINTRARFTANKLYAAVMHEMGHVLGLDHSADPASVMFPTIRQTAALTAGDIANLRALYGVRAVDFNEGDKGNNTIKDATRVKFSAVSGGYNGSTPIVSYGDIGSATDIDFFEVRTLAGYTGPMTFRVQTTGISLLAPRVSLIDQNGRVLQTKTGANTNGTTLNFQIPTSVSDGRYYLRVEASPTATFKFGRYGVAVTFDGRLGPIGISIDQVLRGRFESLKPERVDQLFANPSSIIYEDDLRLDDTALTAIPLRVGAGQPSERDLEATGSISDRRDVDFYEVRAPRATATISNWVMTVSLRAADAKGIVPRLQVLDANQVAVAAQVVLNAAGQYTVELRNVPSRAVYFLRLSSHQPSATGNYNLYVNFGNVPAELNPMAAGRLNAANGFKIEQSLYVARSQLFSFLSVASGSPVTMTIRDMNGQIVYQQVSGPGQTSSGISKVLLPGKYRVTFQSAATATFRLSGSRISDPIGVIYNSPIYEPQYQPDPTVPIYFFPFAPLTPTVVPYGFGPP